jgi:L-threonylcarbamoyladenylate synthase
MLTCAATPAARALSRAPGLCSLTVFVRRRCQRGMTTSLACASGFLSAVFSQASRSMSDFVDWRTSNPDAVLSQVAEAWAAGRLVVLPTEATYEASASALLPEAVQRLQARAPTEQPAIVLSSLAEVHDWLPLLDGPGGRLVRRLPAALWQLEANAGLPYGLWVRLPEAVQTLLAPDQFLRLRWPELPLWWAAVRRQHGPIASLTLPATTASQAKELMPADALIVDAGPTPLAAPPTVIRVAGKEWQVRRAGCLSEEALREAGLCRILFVCTGNTCRSPLAAALCQRLLADELGCAPAELKQRGFLVQSAGLAAMMGDEASPEAVVTAQYLGADLSQHQSQPLTHELLAQADHVLAMTASHLAALQFAGHGIAVTPQLLSPEGHDVVDPLGNVQEVYQACASEILGHLRQRLPAFLQTI